MATVCFGLRDEVLVPNLQHPAWVARGRSAPLSDRGSPRASRRPGVVRPKGHAHDRQGDVTPVADEHDEARIRPCRRELVDVPDVGGCLVAPARRPLEVGVGDERRADGEAERVRAVHSGRQCGRLAREAPEPHARVIPRSAQNLLRRLPRVDVEQEHRLGRDGDVAAVEDQAQHRGAGAVVAEEEERKARHRLQQTTWRANQPCRSRELHAALRPKPRRGAGAARSRRRPVRRDRSSTPSCRRRTASGSTTCSSRAARGCFAAIRAHGCASCPRVSNTCRARAG